MFNSENHYQKLYRKLLLMIIISKDILSMNKDYLSTHKAMPIPPPIQRVAKPFFTSRLIIS